MNEIEKRFDECKVINPYWGDYICLGNCIRGMKYPRSTLIKAFNRLVNDEEYEKIEKAELIDYLENQAKL